MNDIMMLETQADGQSGKFALHSPAKSEEKSDGDEGLGCVPEPLPYDPCPVSTSSPAVSAAALSDLTNGGANHILQGNMTTPVLVLTTTSERGTVQTSVLLDPSSSLPATAPWSSLQLSSLHSLAQANLISDTQQQIAQQLSAHHGDGEEESGGGGGGGGVTAAAAVVAARKETTRPGLRLHSTEKRTTTTKIKFANDLRSDVGGGHKKQIAIFEPQPSEPKTFVCNFKGCGRQFAWQAHFKYHQLTHTNDRRFECEYAACGKRFLTSQRLQVHKRTHTGERPFVCLAEDCGKSFTTAGNLKNHSRVHTGERPFVCEVEGCRRSFAEYSSLHKHSLTHSGQKPFSCEICGKRFSQSGSRRVHLNRHKMEDAKKATLPAEALQAVVAIDDPDFKGSSCVKEEEEQPADLLVLCNSQDDSVQYQDLQNAESVVFPQGLTDHIVTVTTQPADGETDTLEMAHDILGAEEVLVEEHMADPRVGGSSVVVLSQPSPHLHCLHHSPLSHASLSSPHPYHHVVTQSQAGSSSVGGVYDDHSPLLHHDIHQEEISTSHHHHVLSYPPLGPSPGDGQTVAEEIEVGVSSSSSHPRSSGGGSIHMDPMMECDDEYDTQDKPVS